ISPLKPVMSAAKSSPKRRCGCWAIILKDSHAKGRRMNDGELQEKVRVELGARSYDIFIGNGLIASAGREIAARLPGVRAAIVSDVHVAARHGAALASSLEAAGIGSAAITIAPGE